MEVMKEDGGWRMGMDRYDFAKLAEQICAASGCYSEATQLREHMLGEHGQPVPHLRSSFCDFLPVSNPLASIECIPMHLLSACGLHIIP